MSEHGTFHWNELMSRDVERDKRFYRETIGWSFEPMKMENGGTYWCAIQNGQPVAGIFNIATPEFDGVPVGWMPYLAVDDVDARSRQGRQGRRAIDAADLRRARCRPHRHSARTRRRRHRLDDSGRHAQ